MAGFDFKGKKEWSILEGSVKARVVAEHQGVQVGITIQGGLVDKGGKVPGEVFVGHFGLAVGLRVL